MWQWWESLSALIFEGSIIIRWAPTLVAFSCMFTPMQHSCVCVCVCVCVYIWLSSGVPCELMAYDTCTRITWASNGMCVCVCVCVKILTSAAPPLLQYESLESCMRSVRKTSHFFLTCTLYMFDSDWCCGNSFQKMNLCCWSTFSS